LESWRDVPKDRFGSNPAVQATRPGYRCFGSAGDTRTAISIRRCGQPNHSKRAPPLLINAYHAADAFPYRPQVGNAGGMNSSTSTLLRGGPAIHVHHQPIRWSVPPDRSKAYLPIGQEQ
jgi:hypothetical protein